VTVAWSAVINSPDTRAESSVFVVSRNMKALLCDGSGECRQEKRAEARAEDPRVAVRRLV
jgi:hypothetical protein